MFFNVSKTTDTLLNERCKIGAFKLYLDQGWHESLTADSIVFKKGYSIESEIEDAVPNKTGNYCIITCNMHKKTVTIEHDNCRGFPIFFNDSSINNLYPDSATQQCWYGQTIQLDNNQIKPNYKPAVTYKVLPTLSLDQIVNTSVEYFTNYISNFVKYNFDYIVPESKGIDTLTISAMSGKDPDPAVYPIPVSETKLSQHLRQHFWGYTQLSNNYECVGTGFCGDEYMMRNPMYVQWFLMHHGVDLRLEYNKVKNTYMEGFTKHRYLLKGKLDENPFNSTQELFNEIMNNILNDHQMWHLDNVITLTPFKNNFIPELLLRMTPQDALAQVTNAEYSRRIIGHFNSKLIKRLSPNKNNVAP